MRKAGAELQPRLGQPLIIENRGGASGIVAAQACAQAAPDGYTLCVIYHSTMSYNPLLFTNLPYDPDRDLVPVTRLFFLNEGLFVSSALGVNSVAELKTTGAGQARSSQLRHARRRLVPGPVPEMGQQPVGHQNRRRALQGRRPGCAGARRQSGAADALRHRQFSRVDQAGKVKALAVSADKRSPLLPDVPTLAEAGLGGYPGQGWWGLAAPKGTPPAIVDKVNGEFVKLFSEPKFVDYLDIAGGRSRRRTRRPGLPRS